MLFANSVRTVIRFGWEEKAVRVPAGFAAFLFFFFFWDDDLFILYRVRGKIKTHTLMQIVDPHISRDIVIDTESP